MKKTIINTQSKTILADLQTPVSIYLKVRDVYPEPALLESSDFHGNENSVSFIGLNPMARFEVNRSEIQLTYPDGTVEKRPVQPSLVEQLNQFIHSFEIKEDHNTTGYNGFFGYTSYDAVKYFEEIDPGQGDAGAASIPDMIYLFYKYIIVVNPFKNELTIIENRLEGEPGQMDEIVSILNNRNYASYNFSVRGEETSTISGDEYKAMVRKAIQHCRRGDVFQMVLSRCFSQAFSGDDFKVYRALRSINPSPYLFYFDFGSFRIFGSSPETHCRIAKNKAYVENGGCIGYIGLNGDLNQAITIRSFISKNNVLYYQAGAGIVSRSNEESELQEVNNKLGALQKAIDMAVEIIN